MIYFILILVLCFFTGFNLIFLYLFFFFIIIFILLLNLVLPYFSFILQWLLLKLWCISFGRCLLNGCLLLLRVGSIECFTYPALPLSGWPITSACVNFTITCFNIFLFGIMHLRGFFFGRFILRLWFLSNFGLF